MGANRAVQTSPILDYQFWQSALVLPLLSLCPHRYRSNRVQDPKTTIGAVVKSVPLAVTLLLQVLLPLQLHTIGESALE